MAFTIITCPKCNCALLEDSGHCHHCGHQVAAAAPRMQLVPVASGEIDKHEQVGQCTHCGEQFRAGLVRCWKCGAFTRPEIEATYRRMLQSQARPLEQAITLPEIDEATARKMMADESRNEPSHDREGAAAMDDDFDMEFDPSVVTLEDRNADDDLDGSFDAVDPVFSPGAFTEVSDEPPAPIPASPPAKARQKAATPPSIDEGDNEEEAPAPVKKSAGKKKAAVEQDAIMSAALEQEKEIKRNRKAALENDPNLVVVFCPQGCKIRVNVRHRGKVGKCPKCQATFVVPMAPAAAAAKPVEAAPVTGYGKYTHWLADQHWHSIAPAKLKLKTGSCAADVQDMELALGPQGVVLVKAAAGGMFGGDKKKLAARDALQAHFRSGNSVAQLPKGTTAIELTLEKWQQLALAQPAPPQVESMFAGVAVFGEGRIALKAPKLDGENLNFLSFSLSEFRAFVALMAEVYGWANFGEGAGIPLTDEVKNQRCHYSSVSVPELLNLPYYTADKSIKLTTSGWRCQKCSIVVSEAARSEKKLGGANGKGLAKAKCPKCSDKFGSIALYAPPPAPAKPKSSEEVDETAAE